MIRRYLVLFLIGFLGATVVPAQESEPESPTIDQAEDFLALTLPPGVKALYDEVAALKYPIPTKARLTEQVTGRMAQREQGRLLGEALVNAFPADVFPLGSVEDGLLHLHLSIMPLHRHLPSPCERAAGELRGGIQECSSPHERDQYRCEILIAEVTAFCARHFELDDEIDACSTDDAFQELMAKCLVNLTVRTAESAATCESAYQTRVYACRVLPRSVRRPRIPTPPLRPRLP